MVAVIVAGCSRGAKLPAAASDGGTPSSGSATPGQFADLAPGDTAAVIAMMRQIMRGIDAGLGPMVLRDTTIGAVANSVSRHITVWLQEGIPRKLVVIDSSGHGQNNTETDVWFMAGDVAVLLQVTDAYAFDADRIVLWTDESLQPRPDVTGELLMRKQTALIETVRVWLQSFGIALP